jgi:NADH-quinone oxidoreductase subunit E
MLPKEFKEALSREVAMSDHPRENVIDVMFELQGHYGYMSDEAMQEASKLLGMTTLELEELATFYDFVYREPVGKYVIHVCDSTICWMLGHESVLDYLRSSLDIKMWGTTTDGLFTLLPVCCIGYCDRAPAMMINRKVYGHLTPDKVDSILRKLRDQEQTSEPAKS